MLDVSSQPPCTSNVMSLEHPPGAGFGPIVLLIVVPRGCQYDRERLGVDLDRLCLGGGCQCGHRGLGPRVHSCRHRFFCFWVCNIACCAPYCTVVVPAPWATERERECTVSVRRNTYAISSLIRSSHASYMGIPCVGGKEVRVQMAIRASPRLLMPWGAWAEW
jgi:hypothetical protein